MVRRLDVSNAFQNLLCNKIGNSSFTVGVIIKSHVLYVPVTPSNILK